MNQPKLAYDELIEREQASDNSHLPAPTTKPATSGRCYCYDGGPGHSPNSGRCNCTSDGPTEPGPGYRHFVTDPTRHAGEKAICESCRANCPAGAGTRQP